MCSYASCRVRGTPDSVVTHRSQLEVVIVVLVGKQHKEGTGLS